ncbi:L-threonine 3-dehydrogenase [Phenylobacterium sp.]|uniref:L-threonine 3-dehydrogenase n=1 Tax=Phenylobacterium sp. TaxID=1871053 RepID=UPI002FC5912F
MTLSQTDNGSAGMRALSKLEARRGVWMTNTPIPEPGPEDVLIKVRSNAICGTDMHIYGWDDWAAANVRPPMVFGHEFGGEVVEVGSRVTRRVAVGDRVTAEGHIIDLDSDAARAGLFHLDPNTVGLGVNRQGAFAEYVCVPAFNVVALPEAVSMDAAALLDPFGNAVHTAQQYDLVGMDVLVTGAGPIGIMAAAVARRCGARSVVVTDVNPYRLDLASRLADVRPVNVATQSLCEAMTLEKMQGGFDVALEMSGAASAFGQAVDALKMGGRLALLGLPSQSIDTNWSTIIMKALTIRGVYGREMFGTWRRMLGLLHQGFDLEAFITHRLPIERFQEGFDIMGSGQSGKVVLRW